MDSAQLLFVCSALVVQGLGLAATILARMLERSRSCVVWQVLFFAVFFLVGATATTAIAIGDDVWLSCGVTLSLMAVGGTLSPGRTLEAARC